MRILSSENLILLQRCFCWDQPTRSMQSSPRPDAGTQPLCPCRPLLARDAGPAKTRVARPIGSYFPRGSGKQASKPTSQGNRPETAGARGWRGRAGSERTAGRRRVLPTRTREPPWLLLVALRLFPACVQRPSRSAAPPSVARAGRGGVMLTWHAHVTRVSSEFTGASRQAAALGNQHSTALRRG